MSEPSAHDWQPYFGFDEPYPNQADAIETIVDTARASGYLAMEGPCGTGKTMAALTAASYLLRETDQFENAIVVTPVKQQRRQFVEDLRTLNAGIEDPLSGVALVGKRDLCPYGREGVFPDRVGVQARCEELRETTAELVASDSDLEARATIDDRDAEPGAPDRDEEIWWDRARARTLVDAAQRDPIDASTEPLHTGGVTAPYPQSQPATTPEMTESDAGRLYCPFEADWYARDKATPVTFGAGEHHVVTSEAFLPDSVDAGICPHRTMMTLIQHAEVVIGNYNHLFDPASRQLIAPIFGERTLLIVDEAHRLEARVRDLFTDTIGYSTIKRARRDLELVAEPARRSPENKRQAETQLARNDVPLEAVDAAIEFYTAAIEWLETRVDEELCDRFDGYRAERSRWNGPGSEADGRDESNSRPAQKPGLEIPLREPRRSEPDEFTRWAEQNGYDGDLFRSLSRVGLAVEDALEERAVDRECVCTAVGALFGHWWERDHTEYFREIELEPTEADRREASVPWLQQYNASLAMYNCMPSEKIRAILGNAGGGVLMSATLEPLSIFEDVTGLRALSIDEETPRTVTSRTYDLPFPERNRASWIVDVTPFTHRNRGEPTPDNETATRERYAYVARLIARSHGNVLLAWPNYAEAAWAADRLRSAIDKPVLLDRSSTHEETRALKRSFVDGDFKVLVTSTRGTLTEGVDYEGEDLHACAVFGVPLVNIGSPRVQAVQHAYGDRFGENNAFTYALTIPAVRQVRQAIGRVIRGPKERGVRILVGRRYVPGAIHSVYEYLPETEREEFVRLHPEFLDSQLEAFWND